MVVVGAAGSTGRQSRLHAELRFRGHPDRRYPRPRHCRTWSLFRRRSGLVWLDRAAALPVRSGAASPGGGAGVPGERRRGGAVVEGQGKGGWGAEGQNMAVGQRAVDQVSWKWFLSATMRAGKLVMIPDTPLRQRSTARRGSFTVQTCTGHPARRAVRTKAGVGTGTFPR